MRAVLITILCLAIIFPSFSQNTIGIPDIINYTRDQYNAGTQNRGIVQDMNGVVYFANYEGLLSFDGTYWKVYPLPNRTVVRSIALDKDGRIYVGGQNDFGYFSPDRQGKLAYTSLKDLISGPYNGFTDIWNIVPHGTSIFFRSREKIFEWTHVVVRAYPAPSEWQFLGEGNGRLIAQDGRNGLLEFRERTWVSLPGQSALPPGYLATTIFSIGKDSSFLTTVNTGFFILSGNRLTPFHFAGKDPFADQRILTAIPVNEDWLAIGTNLDGCYIINKKGEIIQHLSRKEGLQNNNILWLFLDRTNSLWLGLDDGIDFIAYNNALKHVYPEKLNEGQGYTSAIYQGQLYVGTSNGLYHVPLPLTSSVTAPSSSSATNSVPSNPSASSALSAPPQDLSFINGEFEPVPGTKGSTWALSEINGSLLLGHHDGAFLVSGGQVSAISRRTSYWTFLPLSDARPAQMVIGGNDLGLDILHYEGGRFISYGNLSGFNAASQYMAIDQQGIVWVAHPYKGVYRIDPNGGPATLYTERNGLPSSLKNHLFRLRGRIVVAAEKGIYEFDARTDAFHPSPAFKDLFGNKNIRYLKEDAAGNIWFIEGKNLGVVDRSGTKPEVLYFPELSGKMVADFEHIYPYNASNVFIGAEKGFYHINYAAYKKNRYPIRVRIGAVRAFGRTDSLISGGYEVPATGSPEQDPGQKAEGPQRLANGWNSLHFEFSAPMYAAQSSVEYSYRLEGYDLGWSDWSRKTEKEYTSLPSGDYSFLVRAKSNLGNESAVSSYSFTVLPPWWLGGWAYLAYALSLLGLIWLLYRWQLRLLRRQQIRHDEEQTRMQYLHQLELDKSEKEIVKLRNEKLEQEIGHKNKELAASAMHLVQKGELLGNIREELMRLKKGFNGEGQPEEFKRMLRILGEENRTDKDWEQFAVHFDKVHSNFLRNLKALHPGLSANELKLCAYLRMNLSSKEVARLENISVRGVEIGRYRLRKKLRIPTATHLFDFLMTLPEAPPSHDRS